MTVSRRFAIAFGLTLVLIGAVAAAGFRGLTRIVSIAESILDRDAKRIEHASSLEMHVLDLRRHEKDVFLGVARNVKVAESFTWWKASHEAALEDLAELRRLSGAEDAGTIAAIGANLATYAAGFEEVVGAIVAGRIRTPEAADAAMDPHEDEIRRAGALAAKLAGANAARMQAKGSIVTETEAHTREVIWAWCIIAIVALLVMKALLARGIDIRADCSDFLVPEAGGVVPNVDEYIDEARS